MSGRAITRREVLAAGLAVGGSAGLLPLLAACPDGEARPPDSPVDVFADPASLQGLGRLYLERFPDEADAKVLLQALLTDLEVLPDSRDRLRDQLRSRIEEDFERGDVFQLRGWMLSRTEGRLWALAALDVP